MTVLKSSPPWEIAWRALRSPAHTKHVYLHLFRLKKLGSFKKIDVPVFIPTIKVTIEMGSRKKGKL